MLSLGRNGKVYCSMDHQPLQCVPLSTATPSVCKITSTCMWRTIDKKDHKILNLIVNEPIRLLATSASSAPVKFLRSHPSYPLDSLSHTCEVDTD